MKQSIVKFLTLSQFILLFVCYGYSQKIDVYEGSFDAVKGNEKVNVFFEYDGMSVGDFDSEKEYVVKKVNDKNEDEAGSGDEWLVKWEGDRKDRFEPKFIELFNETLKDKKLRADRCESCENTFIIKTTHTEPGFNIGITRKPAHINVQILLVKTVDFDDVLGEARLTRIPGRDAWGADFDTGTRIQESYALTGKILAKYLSKKVLKK